MQTWTFTAEPTGDIYKSLVDYLGTLCTHGQLVVRPSGLGLTQDGNDVLKQLDRFMECREQRSSWPGTQLYDHTALVHVFHLNYESLSIIKESCDGLFEWQQPERPEDLCMMRSDGSAVLVTIAHEHDAFLVLHLDEYTELLNHCPAHAHTFLALHS